MSPRPGGEADKVGNRYEAAWTVRHLLYVLLGRGHSITVEDSGELAEGAEFTYRRSDAVEVHQLKRQHGSTNNWSVASLHSLGIWAHARRHVQAGREFHFVSTLPAQIPSDLCDHARAADSPQQFDDRLPNKKLREALGQLSGQSICGSLDVAWATLRGTRISWPDENDVTTVNSVLAELLLEGASGRSAATSLGDLVLHNLGVELTADIVSSKLADYGLRKAAIGRAAALAELVNNVTGIWRDSVARELLRPAIPRSEAAELARLALDAEAGLVFVVGTGGGGKSSVVHQLLDEAPTSDMPALAFRLDRLGPVNSTTALGSALGLPVSPVAALAAVVGERRSLLVIDQLDAISLASGRMPQNFDAIADLIQESTAFPGMRVVLACRQFDVDNDHRIRSLTSRHDTRTVTVGLLSDEQVDAAVAAMGQDPATLTRRHRSILRSPLHLVLLATVADEQDAAAFESTGDLFDAYWDRKRRAVRARRDGARYEPVISTVVEYMSARQRLSAPITVLDHDDLANDADLLVSEHVLMRDGQQIAFFHEAFFDYAFARHWATKAESLVEFLTSGEQELFRRAQVRQVMAHLRSSDPERLIEEARALLLSASVRVHIKVSVLAVLGSVVDPTAPEAEMLIHVARACPALEARLWNHLRTPAWFARFDAEGHIDRWLRAAPAEQERALSLMTAATTPDRLAELLASHRAHVSYPEWLRWTMRFVKTEGSRPMLDLLLDAIKAGHYDGHEHLLWMSARGLADTRLDWAVEVLVAALRDRPQALDLDESGHVAVLEGRDSLGADLARKAAEGAPRLFCDALLPYLLRVMEATGRDRNGLGRKPDAHFSYRDPKPAVDADLDKALYAGAASAIGTLVAADPEAMRPTLEMLASDPHDSAQYLLYQGLRVGGAAYADWAAQLLLEGPDRLLCGYTSNSVWATRQVIVAISPHLTDDRFSELETALRDLLFPWQRPEPRQPPLPRRPRRPFYGFTLLSALQEQRLSDIGRRRLGEMRRAFNIDQPPEPDSNVTGGFIGPPIPIDAAARMDDNNWLRAMAKYSGEREDWNSFTGGAREMSHVLRDQAKHDPDRFVRLALRLTPATNPTYGDALLMGLGEAEPAGSPDTTFAAVRHIASLGHSDNDRWFGMALRPHLAMVPLDIVTLLRDRLTAASGPNDNDTDAAAGGPVERHVGLGLGIRTDGINTDRGSLVEALADLLRYDEDGARTAVVSPILDGLVADPSIPVRSCVARLLRTALKHDRAKASEAFWRLIDTDDALLTTDQAAGLLIHLGHDDPNQALPVIHRMLASTQPPVRETGGQLAAFAALEWGMDAELDSLVDSDDAAVRKGAALVCAVRLPFTTDMPLAVTALGLFTDDTDADVRKEAARVAGALRGQALRRFDDPLTTLIDSAAFADALPQLLITLEQAPDHVDDLIIRTVRRFINLYGQDVGDMRTAAAAEAREVGQLVIRGLAQSRTAADRAALLDVLDQLLLTGAYGITDLVDCVER